MKCPRCKETIRSDQKQCGYCGEAIERTFLQKLAHLLSPGKNRERRILEALASAEMPSINSFKDLEVLLKHKIGDEEVAILVRRTLVKVGYKGQVEIKKGGDGNPYKLSEKELEKRGKELMKSIKQTRLPSEREYLEKELDQLVEQSFLATIWINSASEEDFERRKGLIEKALRTAREILKQTYESNLSIQRMADSPR